MYIDNQILFRLDESFKEEAPTNQKKCITQR